MESGENTVIRQTISCDMCGAEKRATNHWYVALEREGELRLGTWAALGKRRARARHLCGQKCLHKLVDDFFVTRAMGVRPAVEEELQPAMDSVETAPKNALQFDSDFGEYESSARLIPTPEKPPSVNMDATTLAPKSATPRQMLESGSQKTFGNQAVPVAALPLHLRASESLQPENRVAAKPAVRSSAKVSESSSEKRRSEAWRREQAREAQLAAKTVRKSEGARLTPNRIEARLHPILRPSALEA
jgi:hypothetical protein